MLFHSIRIVCVCVCTQVLENEVVTVRTKENDRYNALQVGAINHPKPRKVNLTSPLLIYHLSCALTAEQSNDGPV